MILVLITHARSHSLNLHAKLTSLVFGLSHFLNLHAQLTSLVFGLSHSLNLHAQLTSLVFGLSHYLLPYFFNANISEDSCDAACMSRLIGAFTYVISTKIPCTGSFLVFSSLVSFCDQSLSVCLSINFFFKRYLLLNHWSKFKIFYRNVPHDALYQNCTNDSAPLNKRAASLIEIQ